MSSKDIIISCYDGQIISLVDTKKFKKQGIMANDDNLLVTQEEQDNIKE